MLRRIELAPVQKPGFFKRYKYVIALILIIAIAIGWKPIQNIFFQKDFNNSKVKIVIPNKDEITSEQQEITNESDTSDVDESIENSTDVSSESAINEYILSVGDTLAKVLESYDIGVSDVYALTQRYPDLSNKLRPGQMISWGVDDEGRLQSLTWTVSRKETRIYERNDDGFKESIELTQGEWQELVFAGEIGRDGNNTFIGSAQLAGLAVGERYNAARFLDFQVSFKQLKLGDKFSVLVEREMVNGEHVSSRFLAAKMRNRGKDHYVIYFEKYRGYYDEKGQPLADGFLRIPVLGEKSYRISSPFNPARLHPISGRIAPHNGTDFAMPVGTPVLAAADGEVVIARFGPAAGNYVAIRHGRQYMTRYLHLSRFVVKPGQIVKRGDIIAYSGNTGSSTGPHLHYEFHINNRPVNPLKIDLPRPEGLVGEDLQEFKKYVDIVKVKLDDAIKNMPLVPVQTNTELSDKSENVEAENTSSDNAVPENTKSENVTPVNTSPENTGTGNSENNESVNSVTATESTAKSNSEQQQPEELTKDVSNNENDTKIDPDSMQEAKTQDAEPVSSSTNVNTNTNTLAQKTTQSLTNSNDEQGTVKSEDSPVAKVTQESSSTKTKVPKRKKVNVQRRLVGGDDASADSTNDASLQTIRNRNHK